MTDRASWWRVARWSWLGIGGAWGAWVGFGGYFAVPRNADSFASLLASGFFVAFAVLGLLAGMAVGGSAGWLVERVMRRLGAGTTTAVVVASLAAVCAVWQVSSLVLNRYPGLRGPVAQATAGAKASPASPCTAPPPSDPAARKSWEAECR